MRVGESEADRKARARARKNSRLHFDEKLSETTWGWWSWVSDYEEDPLVQTLRSGVEKLRMDVKKRGMVVYLSHSEDYIGRRRLGDRFCEHIFPVLRNLPVDVNFLESLDFRDPANYLRAEKEIEENMAFWEIWSPVQNAVANSLVHVIRATETLHRALEVPLQHCRYCFRRTLDEFTDFCIKHHPSRSPTEYARLRRKKIESAKEYKAWKAEAALLYFAMNSPNQILTIYDKEGRLPFDILDNKLEREWEEIKPFILESFKNELPLVFQEVKDTLELSSSWENAIAGLAHSLEDTPPINRSSAIVFSWLRSAEKWFKCGLGKDLSLSKKAKNLLSEGCSQSQVCKLLGISRQLVSRIARNTARRP